MRKFEVKDILILLQKPKKSEFARGSLGSEFGVFPIWKTVEPWRSLRGFKEKTEPLPWSGYDNFKGDAL